MNEIEQAIRSLEGRVPDVVTGVTKSNDCVVYRRDYIERGLFPENVEDLSESLRSRDGVLQCLFISGYDHAVISISPRLGKCHVNAHDDRTFLRVSEEIDLYGTGGTDG